MKFKYLVEIMEEAQEFVHYSVKDEKDIIYTVTEGSAELSVAAAK